MFFIMSMALGGTGGALIAFGVIIYFVGEKVFRCDSCGVMLDEHKLICPFCNTKTIKYYEQHVICRRCGRSTRYNKYGGHCKYCGTPLVLPWG